MDRKKSFFNLLQFKVHLGIQFILILCFAGLLAFIYKSQMDFLIEDIRKQGMQQAEMVAEASVNSILRENYYALEDYAKRAEYSPLVAYCQITDPSGKSLLEGIGRGGLSREELMNAFSENDVTVVRKEISYDNKKLGEVQLGMFVDKARQEVQSSILQLIIAFAVVLFVVGLLLYFFLNRQIISPVVNMSLLTETLSRGEFVTTTLDRRNDELGILAHGFNNMSRNLEDMYKTLEKRVDERTEDLNNAYHELEAIFDNSLVGIAVLSAEQRVIRSNNRFAAIFGYAPEEMPDIDPEKYHVSGKDFDIFVEKFYNRLTETEIAQLEYQFRKKNGTIFWSQVSAKAIDSENLDRGVIFVIEDITERKKASELLRQHAEDLRVAKEDADKATRSKSEFLARMSHEIRTPMNAILGMAEMLQESGLNEEQNEYVKTFSTAGELLLGIINDILDFSKIEVGQIKLEQIPFNLHDLISDVSRLFVYRAEEKGLDLNMDLDSELATRYIGDPTRLRQILINLTGNALKFTKQGSVSIRVSSSNDDKGAPCCLFSVKDTGIGIPKAKLNAIFDSFAQADSSTTREFGGTGLGLAISKKLVELMGGSIWVESEPNQGTNFLFKLPLAPDFQTPKTEDRPKLSADTQLLVIEDNPAAHDSLASLIRSWGLSPVVVQNGGDAIDSLRAHSEEDLFDAVVIDSLVDGEPGINLAHLVVGQGGQIPHMLLLVDSLQEQAKLPNANDFGPISYLVRTDRDSLLQSKLHDAISESKRRRLHELGGKGWKILLVDDVEANRRVVELFLKSASVSLIHAENGKIAVDKFTAESFDLVLMDMEMPVMDGLEATRRIRLWEQEKRDYRTPIIALTAHALQEHRQKTLEAGCTEFLAKPIKKQALLSIIDLFAGRRESLLDSPIEPEPVVDLSAEPLVEVAPVDIEPVPVDVEPQQVVPTFVETVPEEFPAVSVEDLRPVSEPVGDKGFDDSPIRIDPELEDLRPLFLQTVREFQQKISEAMEAGDFATVQQCGHSLKGLGSTYAVEEISQAGRIIETAARSQQAAVVKEAFNHLAVFMKTGESPKIQTAAPSKGTSPATAPKTDRYVVYVAPEMSELIPFLMDAMQKDLEQMRKFLDQKDYASVRRLGHSHKGFGSTYGFDYISELGFEIQKTAEDRNDELLHTHFDSLEKYLERVDIVYADKDELTEDEIAEPVPGDPAVDVTQDHSADMTVAVDPDLYELLPLFFETMRSNSTEMRQALKEKDFEIITRHGHSQKGLGSTYGFDYLGHLGFKIETAGTQKDEMEVLSLLDEMTAYIDQVKVIKKEG